MGLLEDSDGNPRKQHQGHPSEAPMAQVIAFIDVDHPDLVSLFDCVRGPSADFVRSQRQYKAEDKVDTLCDLM